ncbi:MAG: hypothetical protein LBS30_06835, partial [Planctomycetota bacterium]|nr:hypothetical protein [Planctomycetota bacterium]
LAALYDQRDAYAYAQPAREHQPAHSAPIVHHSPELAMARAALASAPAPASARSGGFVVPPIEPHLFSAPIPELDPVRYQRVAAQPQQILPLLSDMNAPPAPRAETRQRQAINAVSAVAPANSDARRALEPLGQPVQAAQGWTPSPATAMGGRGY